jgi:hypothetical protein
MPTKGRIIKLITKIKINMKNQKQIKKILSNPELVQALQVLFMEHYRKAHSKDLSQMIKRGIQAKKIREQRINNDQK